MNVTALIFIIFVHVVQCSRILIVFPAPIFSHYILGSSLAKELVKSGHQVTIIAAFQGEGVFDRNNYKEVYLNGYRDYVNKQVFEYGKYNPLKFFFTLNEMGKFLATYTLSHPNVQNLLKSNQTFDVVIVEQVLANSLHGFAYHFKAHLISYSTIGANVLVNNLVGNPAPYSYIPNFILAYSCQMNFWQRMVNSLFTIVMELNMHYLIETTQNKILKQFFPDAPELSEINKNISLVFLNSHVSINQPVPNVPNIVNIGGHHIDETKRLPTDLQTFMDDAEDGVILFSMGSKLKSAQMPQNIIKNLLKNFGKLKQRVVWKWEDENIAQKPDNVKIVNWVPQQEILAHSNLQLFITHAGLLSTIETVYFGVPVLAIPIEVDQTLNAGQLVINGIGLQLNFADLENEKLLADTLKELLTNYKYKENVQKRSKLFHDLPIKSMDLATYWVEYVIRHKGAQHLKVTGIDSPLYKYYLLDVFAFVIFFIVILLYLIYSVFRKCSSLYKPKKVE